MDRLSGGYSRDRGIINIIMSKRTLPQRTSRGQPPQYLREPISPSVKQKNNVGKEPVDPERKEMENRLRMQQIVNLKRYPFCRAVHYFFDLDTFQRAKGHLSYAIDASNALENSFSNDVRELNGITYGEVLNRKMFGLPFCSQPDLIVRKDSRFKNVCWGYLFELEDKKYQNDKVLYTLKVILGKLKKGASVDYLRKFQVLRKDVQLQQIFDEQVPLQEKVEIVNQRITAITLRKQGNASCWEPDDKLYYYHSLNQKLHNQILDKKPYLSQQHLLSNIIDSWNLKLENTYRNITYYLTKQNAISGMVRFNNSQPISVIKFKGGMKTMKLAADLVAKRCESMGETTYYQAKQMVKNVFNIDLTLKTEKSQSYPNYQKALRKRCDEIRKNINKVSPYKKQTYLKLDKYLRNGVLSFKGRTEITGKQYHLILIFYWLCQGLSELAPIFEQFPDILGQISSDYFVKMYSYLVQVTGSPIVGMLCMAIETLADMFSKPDPFLQARLFFEFEQTIAVGLLYAEELEYQTEMSSRQRQGTLYPSKKVKRDY